MDGARRQVLARGAAVLFALVAVPAWAGVNSSDGPVRLAVADNDTPGAVKSYNAFLQELERRFGAAGKRFVVAFFPVPMLDVPKQKDVLGSALVAYKPDVIFASNSGLALASAALKTGKPIIFYSNSDPVAGGLTDSLTRPSKGMTGFTLGKRASIKRREMLLRLAPSCRVIGLVGGPGDVEGQKPSAADAADTFPGIEERAFYCSSLAEMEKMLSQPAARGIDGWDIDYTFVPYRYAEETVELFNRSRKPIIYPRMKHVHMGGMAAYVPKIEESDEVWASQLALLLAGVPIDKIPVVQATRYSFGLNLRACHRVGVKPSAALIKIADVVVE